MERRPHHRESQAALAELRRSAGAEPSFVRRQTGHKPERGVAPAPSHFACQDDQSPEGAVEELRVAASLLALRSAYGGTIHSGGACGGVPLPGKRANHGGVAAQSKPLRMDAIRDEVQLTLIRRVCQRNVRLIVPE